MYYFSDHISMGLQEWFPVLFSSCLCWQPTSCGFNEDALCRVRRDTVRIFIVEVFSLEI